MDTNISQTELQRLSKAELCILLDQAYQALVGAEPGSADYHAALALYETIYKVLNQKLARSWVAAAHPHSTP